MTRGLIDTTEMYLKAILELEEDGVHPLRARLAERFALSAPTVSQTVARLGRDGLVEVTSGRVVLTEAGRDAAVRVLRKHRLAEVLLFRVVGLEWPEVHAEACRWEHVMSDEVERRTFELCGRPVTDPYGNRIPGLSAFGLDDACAAPDLVVSRASFRSGVLTRISDRVQDDTALLRALEGAALRPGARVAIAHLSDGTELRGETAALTLTPLQAGSVHVAAVLTA